MLFSGFRNTFLSTPSARRATGIREKMEAAVSISIHALREEGDRPGKKFCGGGKISIHALREEGDAATCCPGFA